MKPIKLAYLNLTRRKVSSLIAILAIAIAVAVSGILLRLNILAESRFSAMAKGGDAIVGAKSGGIEIILGALNGEGQYPSFIPYNLYESLKAGATVRFEDGAQNRPDGIESIIPFVYFAKFRDYRVAGTDETFIRRPVEKDSMRFTEGRWTQQLNEVVVGSAIAKAEGLKLGDSIDAVTWAGDKVFNVQGLNLKVVGILQASSSAWDRMLFTSIPTAHTALSKVNLKETSIWGPRVLHYYMIYLRPMGFESLSALVNNRTVGQAIFVQDEIKNLHKLVGVGTNLGFFVTVLILILGGLSVTSMLVTRFDAMSMQLAMLRAIGYRKGEIGCWLLWEGFLLGVAATILGIIFDLIGFPMMRNLLGDALPAMDIVGSSILYSYPIWITAIAATTMSVFVPMFRIYRQDVHFSLRN